MRPLSTLQQSILMTAAAEPWGVVAPWRIKAAHYGFPVARRGRSVHFNRKQIGVSRYVSVSGAITQACRRLETRGLLRRTNLLRAGSCTRLTKRGRVVASKLKEQTNGKH